MNVGWQGGIDGPSHMDSLKINPKTEKLTQSTLNEILRLFKNKINDEIKNSDIPTHKYLMTNEILVKNPVDLHKYLTTINKKYLSKDDIKYVKENYPNVKLV
jgi:hypothetical protein